MLPSHDLGASLYKDWTDKQRRAEIAKLVEGYRNGLPVGIFCKMSETIAGSKKKARKFIGDLIPLDERRQAVEKETGGVRLIVEELFL